MEIRGLSVLGGMNIEIRGLTVLEVEDGYSIKFFDCKDNHFIKIKADRDELFIGDDPRLNLVGAINFISANRHRWCIDKPWLFMQNIN